MQPIFRDETGAIPYILGYCLPLSTEENDTQWMARGLIEKYDATKNTRIFVIQRDGVCPVRIQQLNLAK
jgi:hypothetical protein